ncbi:hypothetical protein C0J52_14716 [Blattella germanica]|nr:hypothetical protein C0J52_14716 [Blattella germanica]
MATFSFKDQRVIICFLHLRGVTPIEIHRQLSETCGDGVMIVKNVRSWVRQFKEGRTLLEKRSQRQWHHGEDVVKNVYVYRGIMWRSDKSFRIFAHLV